MKARRSASSLLNLIGELSNNGSLKAENRVLYRQANHQSAIRVSRQLAGWLGLLSGEPAAQLTRLPIQLRSRFASLAPPSCLSSRQQSSQLSRQASNSNTIDKRKSCLGCQLVVVNGKVAPEQTVTPKAFTNLTCVCVCVCVCVRECARGRV